MKKNDFVKTHYSIDVNKKQNFAYFWMGAFIMCFIVLLCTVALLFYTIKNKKTVGYVVEVNTQTGATSFKENAVVKYEDYVPSESVVKTDLEMFVKNFLSVSIDENVQREWIRKTYAHVEKSALAYIANYYNNNPPLVLQKTERRDIRVYSNHKINENTYQLLFRETRMSLEDGRILSDTNNKVTLHIRYFKPQTEYDVEQNNNGIFVDDLSFSLIKEGVATDYDLIKE